MGIYDRDYGRQRQWRDSYGNSGGGFELRFPETMVNRILLVTVVAYLVEVVFFNGEPVRFRNMEFVPNSMLDLLGVQSDHPWRVFQLFTYALVHDNTSVWHVAFNMFGVWMFGRELERRLGGREFLLFYLAAVLAGGLAARAYYSAMQVEQSLTAGASAGTVACVLLFALFYPRKEVLLYFAIPVPMWLVGVMLVGGDLMRAVGPNPNNISWQGHLGGAALAALYFTQGIKFSKWLPEGFQLSDLRPKPKLRVHSEYDLEDAGDSEEQKLAAEVDRILSKINDQGADSLSSKEKKILERASRQYKDRRGV